MILEVGLLCQSDGIELLRGVLTRVVNDAITPEVRIEGGVEWGWVARSGLFRRQRVWRGPGWR